MTLNQFVQHRLARIVHLFYLYLLCIMNDWQWVPVRVHCAFNTKRQGYSLVLLSIVADCIKYAAITWMGLFNVTVAFFTLADVISTNALRCYSFLIKKRDSTKSQTEFMLYGIERKNENIAFHYIIRDLSDNKQINKRTLKKTKSRFYSINGTHAHLHCQKLWGLLKKYLIHRKRWNYGILPDHCYELALRACIHTLKKVISSQIQYLAGII